MTSFIKRKIITIVDAYISSIKYQIVEDSGSSERGLFEITAEMTCEQKHEIITQK